MININNKKYWNIVKGVGILSIVIGHSCHFLVPFVYMFHLAIFFFLGGYFYKEDKYGDNPYNLLISKLKSNWEKYFVYSLFFILLHNIFFKLGIIINTNIYSISNMTTSIINTSLFFGTETLSGALWFVPVYIFASVLFGIIVYYSRKVSDKKNMFIIACSVLFGLLGCYLIHRNIYLMLHVQTSFLVIPFFMIGYFLNNYINDLKKYLNIVVGFICMVVLIYLSFRTNFRINLTDNITGNYLLFYFVSCVGIYFCLVVSYVFNKIKLVEKLFNFIGRYSFEIMAFHFLIIKIIDFIYSLPKIMNGTISSDIYGIFPYAYKNLWPVYIILGTLVPALLFYLIDMIRKNNFNNNKIINDLKSNSKIKITLFILLIICVGLPILRLGIMHNDELMSRFWSSQGFASFYKHYFVEQIEKGRALSSFIIPITMYLGFIGQNSFSFKFFQYISILLCLIFMSKLLYNIFNDKKIVLVYSLIFLSFIQISFEPTVPNVFVTFYNISICALLYSLLLYWKYLNNNNIKYLTISALIFFIVELTYESFITFIPIYILLYIYKKGFKNIFKDLKAILIPVGTGMVYLIFYVLCSKLFPSNYSGNQIGNINIINSIKIISNLGYYSFPGSYLTSDKYSYLLKYHLNFNSVDMLRLGIFVILFFIIILVVLPGKSNINKKMEKVTFFKTIFAGICVIILPIIPISIASMYQEMDIGGITLGLPVSFFCYFGSVLIVTIISIYIAKKYKYGKYVIIVILLILSTGVQLMNNIFSREAAKDFNRILTIERFLDSNLFNKMNNSSIYSKDLFITKHTLFVHDSHWNDFAKLHNIPVTFINSEGNENDVRLYYLENINTFKLIYNNKIYYISENDLKNKYSNCLVQSNEFLLKSNWKLYELNGNNLICDKYISYNQ